MSRHKTEEAPYQGDELSNHAYQQISVTVAASGSAPSQRVNIGTWNLLNQCHSRANNPEMVSAAQEVVERLALVRKRDTPLVATSDHSYGLLQTARKRLAKAEAAHERSQRRAYTNNPYDFAENDELYATRKRKQIAQICERLDAGEDILCLQEVDFCTITEPTEIQKELKREFLHELMNRECIAHQPHGKGCGDGRNPSLVTVYRFDKFIAKDSQGVLQTADSWRGWRTRFIFRNAPQQFLTVTNVHSSHEQEFGLTLAAYQTGLQDSSERHLLFVGESNRFVAPSEPPLSLSPASSSSSTPPSVSTSSSTSVAPPASPQGQPRNSQHPSPAQEPVGAGAEVEGPAAASVVNSAPQPDTPYARRYAYFTEANVATNPNRWFGFFGGHAKPVAWPDPAPSRVGNYSGANGKTGDGLKSHILQVIERELSRLSNPEHRAGFASFVNVLLANGTVSNTEANREHRKAVQILATSQSRLGLTTTDSLHVLNEMIRHYSGVAGVDDVQKDLWQDRLLNEPEHSTRHVQR